MPEATKPFGEATTGGRVATHATESIGAVPAKATIVESKVEGFTFKTKAEAEEFAEALRKVMTALKNLGLCT